MTRDLVYTLHPMLAGNSTRDGATRWSDQLPASLPSGLAAWLADHGLLTPRMRSFRPTSFRLTVRAEYSRELTDEECRLLGVSGGRALEREISMGGAGDYLVFGTSVIPATTLEHFPSLGELGERPLGEALASLDNIRRGPFEYSVFQPGESGYPELPSDQGREQLFARRSVIRAQGHPILVVEYFRAQLAAPEEEAL